MMKRNVFILCALVTAVMFFAASCVGTTNDDAYVNDTGTDSQNTTVYDDITNDTEESTDDTTADTSEDTTTSPNATDEAGVELVLPTKEEWDALEFGYDASYDSYNAICALLAGDIDGFARVCGVNPEVYESMKTVKIASYKMYCEDIADPYIPNRFNKHPVLEIEVTQSENEFLSVGTHQLVFDEGLYLTFCKREDFGKIDTETTAAYSYVCHVGSDSDFYSILGEGRSQFGLSDFIVARLNAIAGDYEPRTAEEIRAYAEKYLGVDGDTLALDWSLEKVDGGYIRIGRGSASDVKTYLGEEIRDGVTVVTVQFFADYSKTVPSRKVEFHLGMLDGEYYPIKTVILEDSEFRTVYFST